jgi:DCN1-like protein 1/2
LDVNYETDLVVYAVMMNMKATSYFSYSFEEFKRGCDVLNADTMNKWDDAILGLREMMKDEEKLRQIYDYTYSAHADESKGVYLMHGCNIWKLYFGENPKFTDFSNYCLAHKSIEYIDYKTWTQVYHFMKS